MKKIDCVIQFVENNLFFEKVVDSLKKNRSPGISATDIQIGLGIVRNNASTILNHLWKENRLIKVNSRPVTFLTPEICSMNHSNHTGKEKNNYTLQELKKLFFCNIPNLGNGDPFQLLLGNGSLSHQIGQAKSAITYPPKGLHTLIIGENGIGKTAFAKAMHAYGMLYSSKSAKEFPLISLRCANYFDNPQLLLSQLFGHARSAFPGASNDKSGLIEQADGGVLLLNEVHRLPPEGQEALLRLMEQGEYSRLGEHDVTRKCNILIIAATTEDLDSFPLESPFRSFPVTIALPSYSEKPVGERVEILNHFFHLEASRIGQPITLAPEILKALTIYPFKIGNIRQLHMEIRRLCVKAFLLYLQTNQTIQIDFSILPKEIREVLFDYVKLDMNTKNYLRLFSENIITHPSTQEHTALEHDDAIYTSIKKHFILLKSQGLDDKNVLDALKKEIDDYFGSMMKNIYTLRANLPRLYKLVPKEVVDVTSEFIEFAQQQLSVEFNNRFIFSLSFHIQALLDRVTKNKIARNPHRMEIKNTYPCEFAIAGELVKKLHKKFGLMIPDNERTILAQLISTNKADAPDEAKINMIILCHGNTTATSIADVANTLLNTDWIKAIDMPLYATVKETYQRFRSTAIATHRGKGILLLADMGSLLTFGDKLTRETGILAKTIPAVTTPLALEALRNILYKNDDLSTIYSALTNTKEQSGSSIQLDIVL